MTTLNTPFGLYAVKFLPFGLSVSSSVFQAIINDIISGLPNVLAYQDDLIVFTRSGEDHQRAVRDLLERLLQFNVRINKEKSSFFKDEITYLGYVLGKDGIQPDPTKFQPIVDAPEPTNSAQLHSILGSLQYYSRFVANFAEEASCLFELCRKDTDFVWTDEHSAALRKLKTAVFNKRLKSFNPNEQSTLVCDASEHSIGGVLEQNGCPIICVSRKMSVSEVGYSQTQREALAIHWCVKRLHKFLFGTRFRIVTDHSALAHILHPSASVSKATSHMLQRWSLRLSMYEYEIEYREGKKIPQADFLSRYARCSDSVDPGQTALFLNPLPIDAHVLRQETKRFYGPVLQALRNGWSPRARKQFRDLYVLRDELNISSDEFLLFRDRTIIPPVLRGQILNHLHVGHISIEKMKSLSRLLCFWNSINQDIKSFVDECQSCQGRTKNARSDWKAWPATYEPMQRIHADYAGPFLRKYYLLVVIDTYSRWPEVFITESANASFTQRALRALFAREGVPQAIVTDNGTHFTERELSEWLQSLGVVHLFSAPRHPKSNGQAENLVKTIKYALSAEKIESLEDLERSIQNFLFQYRNVE
ncbi:MAG: RNase H-like domain-containing protein, partial [Verrucomicrobiota bacterium]